MNIRRTDEPNNALLAANSCFSTNRDLSNRSNKQRNAPLELELILSTTSFYELQCSQKKSWFAAKASDQEGGRGVKKTMSKPESIHKFPFEYVPELLPAATHSLTVPTSTRNDTHTFSSVHLVEKVFVIRPWSLTNSNDSTESKPRNQEKALADSDY